MVFPLLSPRMHNHLWWNQRSSVRLSLHLRRPAVQRLHAEERRRREAVVLRAHRQQGGPRGRTGQMGTLPVRLQE